MKRPHKRILLYWPVAAVVTAIVLLRAFVLVWGIVPSASMEPSIPVPSVFVASKLYTCVERGDIICFRHDEADGLLVKRVIGMPGERVEVSDGLVYIDGVVLAEPYLPENMPGMGPDMLPFELPDDGYFVLGDNRGVSLDARFWQTPYVLQDEISAVLVLHCKIF